VDSKIEIVQRHYANVSAGTIEHDREIVSKDIIHESLVAGTVKGLENFLSRIKGFKQSFPDLQFDLRTIAETGDIVMVEGLFTGTNTGPMSGPGGTVPATGKTVRLPFVDVWKISNGQISENRIYYDQVTFLGQLGLGNPSQ